MKKFNIFIFLILILLPISALSATTFRLNTKDAKTTLVNADIFFIEDSASAWATKKTSGANIKTFLSGTFAATLGTDDNYVTDAEKTVIGNTSGTNTGDVPAVATVRTTAGGGSTTAPPTEAAVGDGLAGKQATLVSGTNIKTINSTSLLGSGDIVVSGAGDVVGPASATDTAIVLYDGTTGKLIKNSICTISATGHISCAVTDGNAYSVLPNNTSIAPLGDGSEEIYNEGGQIKVVEADTEYDLLHSGDIDDTPSDGNTTQPASSNSVADLNTALRAKYVSGTEADFYGTILDPQAVYAVDGTNHAITLINNVPAAFTITEISISCDADPTTELTMTFQHKTAGVGYGSPTTIEAVVTDGGTVTFTTGFDDATIPAGTKVFATLSDPDDALNECAWQIEGDWD